MAGSTADLIASGAAALSAGKQIDSNSIDSASPGSASSNVSVDEGVFTTAGESTVDDLLPDGSDGEKAEDSTSTPEAKPDASKAASSKETLTVTDESGRRQKIEIDYSDKKAIKDAFSKAAGMRKFQAERDAARQEAKAEAAAKAELKSNWDALEGAFQKSGIEGVIDLLEGKQGAYKSWEKKAIDRARFLEKASPEEVQALEAREAADRSAKELERIRKENEDFRREMSGQKEEADVKMVESRIHPTFDRHRFAGKLGDANDEQMFDEMLWTSAMKRLEPYEQEFGHASKIPPEIIEREFKAVGNGIRKRIGLQAEKKATKVVEQKKQEATENVQSKVKAGYKASGTASGEARDFLNSGDLTGLLKNWGRLGGVFNGKK